MDNSTLPPLFDNMDNVDITSSIEDSEIFQSAIQVRDSFVFLIKFSLFRGVNLAKTLSNYSHKSSEFLQRIFSMYSLNNYAPFNLCWCQETF